MTFQHLPAVWRVLTAAVFHMGILHLAFNMLAFVPIGQSLERLVGTVQVRGAPATGCSWRPAQPCCHHTLPRAGHCLKLP